MLETLRSASAFGLLQHQQRRVVDDDNGLMGILYDDSGLNHSDYTDDYPWNPCISDDTAQSHVEFDAGLRQDDAAAAAPVNHDDNGLFCERELNPSIFYNDNEQNQAQHHVDGCAYDYHVHHYADVDEHVQHYDENNVHHDDTQKHDDNHGNDDAVVLTLLDPVENEDEFVEVDPDNRYGRNDDLIGTGAIKRVYRGFDKQEGIEVAWNQVHLHNASHVKNEIHLLDTLKHKNIIRIYKFWVDRPGCKINFITELCSNTLLGFRRQHRHVCMKAVKDWAQQILRALTYLHSQNPPIIHRDLKCENIFVNCSSGKIKIGDFGSATRLDTSGHLQNLVGTPEFMAPEMFGEDYNELVDVYAFGMCMIELLTVEIPYKECENIVQIYQKVRGGVMPKALEKIKDVETLRFIRKCLAPVSQRPSAVELLLDPFLLCDARAQPVPGAPILMKCASSPNLERARTVSLMGDEPKQHKQKKLTSHSSFVKERSQREVTVFGKVESESKLMMRLRIVQPDASGPIHVNFPYDCNCDTPESVAEEMVQELDFPRTDSALIADVITSALASLIQGKPSNEEEGRIGAANSALSSRQASSCLKAAA